MRAIVSLERSCSTMFYSLIVRFFPNVQIRAQWVFVADVTRGLKRMAFYIILPLSTI